MPSPTDNKVYVTIDNSVPPNFSISPRELPVETGKGTITWLKGDGGRDFSFAAVAFYATNPFSNTVVSDQNIYADDDNKKKESQFYSLLVKVLDAGNHMYYSSLDGVQVDDGPTIRNK